jgi:hypothetical protein
LKKNILEEFEEAKNKSQTSCQVISSRKSSSHERAYLNDDEQSQERYLSLKIIHLMRKVP